MRVSTNINLSCRKESEGLLMISFILFSSWYEEMSYVKEYKGIYGHIQTMQ